ncbi:hypothetical protein AB5J52_47770 [Streptomyces sp. R39]|uniref:Uncharacterized protein n=1 Tax=Streptomyces sp. R39 TaxID=3238631 RepID=A0AB39R095_9ACTN
MNLDLAHLYVLRDRAATVEHLADLKEDQVAFAARVRMTTYKDTPPRKRLATWRPLLALLHEHRDALVRDPLDLAQVCEQR